MELAYLFLAENADVREGKFFVFGGGISHAHGEGFPALIPSIALVAGLRFEPEETQGAWAFHLRSIDPDGNPFLEDVGREVTPMQPLAEFPDQAVYHPIVVRVGAVSLPRPGVYTFVAVVNDQELGRVAFRVS
jgi:hypothetical protein